MKFRRFVVRDLALTLTLTACASASVQRRPAESSSAAEEWYYIADDGVRQYVTEFGLGDTVIVLHGGPGAEHSYLLDAVMPLADRFHFVLYDQRGSLRSPAPDSTISLDRLVRDLDGLRRQLGVKRAILLGHSAGTVLSYAYLAQHPDDVRGLVLTGAVLPTANAFRDLEIPPSDTAHLRAVATQYRATQEAHRKSTIEADRLDRTGLSDREKTEVWRIGFAAANLCHVERWREMKDGQVFYNPRVGTAMDHNASAARQDSLWSGFLPALEHFSGPISIVLGDCDFVDPGAAEWQFAAAKLPNARLTVIHDAGHNAWLDQPGEYRSAVARALDRAANR